MQIAIERDGFTVLAPHPAVARTEVDENWLASLARLIFSFLVHINMEPHMLIPALGGYRSLFFKGNAWRMQ